MFYIRKLRLLHYFLFFNMLTAMPSIASANGGPTVIHPETKGLTFDEDSGIALEEEVIIFTERHQNSKYQLDFDVEVIYRLRNIESILKEINMLFVGADYLKISINNGESIIFENGSTKTPSVSNWDVGGILEIVDPTTNRLVASEGLYSMHRGQVDVPIVFQPNELLEINIQYEYTSGYYNRPDVVTPIYTSLYFLTPAKFWEGDARINMELNLLEGRKKSFYSNIPMVEIDQNTYRTALSEVPEEEWIFSIVNKGSLIFGTNNNKIHNFLVVSSAAAILILTGFISAALNKRSIVTLAYYAVFIYVVTHIRKLSGYPFNLIWLLIMYILMIILMFMFDIIIYPLLLSKLRGPRTNTFAGSK